MSGMTIYQFNAAKLRQARERYDRARANFQADKGEFIAASLELHRAKGLEIRKPRKPRRR